MEGIYLEKNNSIAHFINGYKDNTLVEISSAAPIAKSAFAHSDVEKILFKGCPKSIGEIAFEECESLTTVIFGELGKDKAITVKKTDEKNDKKPTGDGTPENDEAIEQSVLKNVKLASATGDFTIQANAFKDCAKLATLVLPKLDDKHKLVIEKDAFCGCRALRTVVALCDKISFTGNPFADSPEHLTFVCKEDSEVARFARENSYRSAYVG
ncbi:MAG: leucine-rich repeat domain-containing protein [Treponemataceae bacterium]|nr:leucine-rich repeat domain-containing protein [Treponemataceae bacterium]